MQLQTVDSSMLYAIGYDQATQALEVVFHAGGIYRYERVPQSVYDELMAAPSKGRYMRQHVFGQYSYRRLHRQRLGRRKRTRT